MHESGPNTAHNSTNKQAPFVGSFKKSKTKSMMAVCLILVLCLVGAAYKYGLNSGKKKSQAVAQKQATKTAAALKGLPAPIQNYWSVVGSVEAVTDTTVTVKNNKGTVQEAVVAKDAKISSKTAQNLTLKDVKKGNNVIVTGTKDNNVNNASMIRIK